MSALITFPLPPRYAVQPRPDAMPLTLRVVVAGRRPWPSDGDTGPLHPPLSWRRFGSRLAPIDFRGPGIWSPQNFLRLQIRRGGDPTATPPATSRR